MNPARWPPIHFTVALSYCLFGWKKFLNLNWNYFFKNQTKEKHFSQSFTDSFGYLLANRVAPLGIKLAIGDQKIWSRHLRCLEFLSSSLLVVFLRTRTDFQSAFQTWMSTSLPSRFCYYRQLSVLWRTLKLFRKYKCFLATTCFVFSYFFLLFDDVVGWSRRFDAAAVNRDDVGAQLLRTLIRRPSKPPLFSVFEEELTYIVFSANLGKVRWILVAMVGVLVDTLVVLCLDRVVMPNDEWK